MCRSVLLTQRRTAGARSVRQDLVGTRLISSDYKSALSSQTDALLQDRGRIDSSHRMIDETLGYVQVLISASPHPYGYRNSSITY